MTSLFMFVLLCALPALCLLVLGLVNGRQNIQIPAIVGAAPNPADASADAIFTPSAAGKEPAVVNTSSTQPMVIRQLGGTAGTDEVQVWHDGTDARIRVKDGGTLYLENGVIWLQTAAAAMPVFIVGGSQELRFDGTSGLQLLAGNTAPGLAAHRGGSKMGITFDDNAGKVSAIHNGAAGAGVAGLVMPADSAGNVGWFQDSAGALALASAFTDVTATLAATAFSFPVINGRTYKITGFIAGDDSTATDGWKMDFDGGSATVSSFELTVESTGLGTVVLGTAESAALATDLTATTFTNARLRLTGYLVASSTGTIIVRMAQNAHTAGTLTINAGSWINLEDMRAV